MIPEPVLSEIAAAARAAGHDPATLLAIAEVESGGRVTARVNGRDEPLIRFEGHYFDRRLTGRDREIARAAGLASPSAGRIANPVSQEARWALLARAEAIDKSAARESCSWGLGQVMGAHWAWLGYASIDELVAEARSGVAGQLRLLLRYIDKAGLSPAMSARDWAAFARGYNGPAYAANGYDRKLAAAWYRYKALNLSPVASAQTGPNEATPISPTASPVFRRGMRGQAVEDLQRMLSTAGHPASADGSFGAGTEKAVIRFQKAQRLSPDGIAGPATLAALRRSLPASTLSVFLGRMRTFLLRIFRVR